MFIFQVSTYALFVDDVLEVFADTVVVRDAAVSRMQRLTKVLSVGKNTSRRELRINISFAQFGG